MLAYIGVNELIGGSHPGIKYEGIWTYPELFRDQPAQKYSELSRSNMVIHVSIFAMTVRPKHTTSQKQTFLMLVTTSLHLVMRCL